MPVTTKYFIIPSSRVSMKSLLEKRKRRRKNFRLYSWQKKAESLLKAENSHS